MMVGRGACSHESLNDVGNAILLMTDDALEGLYLPLD